MTKKRKAAGKTLAEVYQRLEITESTCNANRATPVSVLPSSMAAG